MNNAFLVRRLEAFGNLAENRQGFIDRDRPSRNPLR